MTFIFARGRALKARRISQVGNDRESRHAPATAFLGHMPSDMPSDAPAGSWTRARIMPMNGPGQRRRDHAVGYAGGIVDARPDERTGATRGRRAGATSGSCRWDHAVGWFGAIRGRTDRGNAGGIMPSDGSGQFVDARPDIVDGGAGVMPMNGPGQFVDEWTEATPAGSCRRMVRGNAGGIVDGARGSSRRRGVMKIFRTARGALPEGARHDR